MILLKKYLEFLRNHQGNSAGTVTLRKQYVERFLRECRGYNRPSTLNRLTPRTIHCYVIKTIRNRGRATRKHVVNSLRSFLKFAYINGYTSRNLVESVPVIRTTKLAGLPSGCSWSTVEKLLSVPDQRTAVGRRDYAIFMLLATYGVRSGQIARLRLQDIKWRTGTITFHALKGGKTLHFPLQQEVARALLAYIKTDRQHIAHVLPEVFLTIKGIPQPLRGQLWNIVSNYFIQAKLSSPKFGPHSIRHAFATRQMEKGTPIKSISDLLGHKSINSTFIYTKVDLNHLCILSRDWPAVEVMSCGK